MIWLCVYFPCDNSYIRRITCFIQWSADEGCVYICLKSCNWRILYCVLICPLKKLCFSIMSWFWAAYKTVGSVWNDVDFQTNDVVCWLCNEFSNVWTMKGWVLVFCRNCMNDLRSCEYFVWAWLFLLVQVMVCFVYSTHCKHKGKCGLFH